ncbi:general substrate transporter [Cercophora scortea]|uniref:General substrate transporter n=1 Tax=Cercophora scortea TaxID=314031 RepID=A0AAE0IE67_9PEZI|nr:general substrate transporter [Cercophora scortea]
MPPALTVTDALEDEEIGTLGVRKTGVRANWRILAITMYLGLSLFEYGFDKGAIAGFQAMPGFLMEFGYKTPAGKWAIERTPQQIISSFMILGAFIGSLLTGPIGARLCRRYSLMLSSVIVIISIAIMTVTTSFGALYFSRFLCGVANGMLLNFSMVYLQESAPPHMRGLCFAMVTSWITIGTTIGFIINRETSTIMNRSAYQIPLYVCYPAPAILFLTLYWLPESPRWLINHGREEAALKSLRFLRKGAYDEVALQQEFEEMRVIAAREAETQHDWRLIFELFKGTNLRRTIICVGVGTANAGVGAMFILAFGTYFFQVAEISDAFTWTIISNCIGLAGLMLTWVFITRVGRRPLILAGCIICTLCMLLMGILYSVPGISHHGSGIGLIVVVSMYLFGFNFGLEPYVYLVAGEMPAQNLRAYTMGLAAAVSFAFAWLCSFTTPYYINPTELNWGPKYGFLWFGAGLVVTLFVYFMLPEVRGRTLEEIDEMFRNKVPMKDFKTYVCMEVEHARERGAANAAAFNKLGGEEKPGETYVEDNHAAHVKA